VNDIALIACVPLNWINWDSQVFSGRYAARGNAAAARANWQIERSGGGRRKLKTTGRNTKSAKNPRND
jgi:hypothetical protein